MICPFNRIYWKEYFRLKERKEKLKHLHKIPFLSKYYDEQKISHRYKIAFATLITGIVDLFTIPFGYTCNYQVDVIERFIIWGIEQRKKLRRS